MNAKLGCLIALVAAVSIAPPVSWAQSGRADGAAIATFAGGCFWCVEEAFDQVDGVLSTTSGFMGGKVANPSYEQVTSGATGHREVVRVAYDPERVSYERLLDTFWRNIDPTQKNGQFCDSGEQYRSEIFVHDEAQKRAADASLARLNQDSRFSGAIQTRITLASEFYPADDYHQDFHEKNFARYQYYKSACGRVARLRFLWRDR